MAKLYHAKKGIDYTWNHEVTNPYLQKNAAGDRLRTQLLKDLKNAGEHRLAEFLQQDIQENSFNRDIIEGYLLAVGRLER